MTLRITRGKGSASRALLKLEGRLVAAWAALLEAECSDLLRSGEAVCLDLTGVRFVDRDGVQALARLSGAGVEILCSDGAVASVLEGEGIRVTRAIESVDEERP